MLGSDFLEHYDCVIDIKNQQLIPNFKTVPLFKVEEHYEKFETVPPCTNKVNNGTKIQIKM